ncbi:hypothetical protein FisN_12Lh140 [Fistulifera solaris]|jgi:Fe-S cluster biogenesis protein NfuA|uniref:NIF system FeS cluster assembly NifU C-terminal domain-containing protein n=1 Tax=Fistulifera solaris TaxID=1519565 RepID=A0A1Z5JMF7_FISSO|nr:hypothetical protein FisN_12Lh140 [Fistulifera solaris]|eukprot:GAX15159.1 hypothetical protein FisN_12Lh140 [Fistulifera solaris]
MRLKYEGLFAFLLVASGGTAFSTHSFGIRPSLNINIHPKVHYISTALASTSSEKAPAASSSLPGPSLDGKRVLPYRILAGSLKGQAPVAAVYAVLSSNYQRGQEGWNTALHIGVTQDLMAALESHVEKHGPSVAHVRAISFAAPQPNAMQKIAADWKELAREAGASLQDWGDDVLGHLYDDDDDDDDEFEEDAPVGDDVVSPFELPSVSVTKDDGTFLELTMDNVDKVLDEVRPYLIADGGNVAVDRVDSETGNIYLKLEGACGSCPSSTVTMQMGVERVLRENFANINQVLRVDDDPLKPKELTWGAVEQEVNRLGSAIVAMGGVMRLLDVDANTGIVRILFKGPKRVQQGLELALRDVEYVTDVVFTEEE